MEKAVRVHFNYGALFLLLTLKKSRYLYLLFMHVVELD